MIPEDLLTLLREVDTPTVCNGIEVVHGKRGFDAFTHGTMVSSAPEDPAIVAVNPGSLLASKMVKDAFGIPGAHAAVHWGRAP